MSWLPFDTLVCWQITLTLLHISWIGLVIGLIAAFANRVLQNSGANRRYWMNFASLLLLAASLPVTYAIVRSQTAEDPAALVAVETTVANLVDLTPPDVEQSASFAPPTDAVNFAPAAPQGPLSDTEIRATAPTPPLVQATPSAWERASSIGHASSPFIAILYAIGVALMFVKLAFGVRVSRRLRSASQPITDTRILARMATQAKKLAMQFTPVIAYCEHTAVPIVVGLLRPIILIPTAMVNGLTIEQLESVLTHELAHLRRRDHLMIVVQRVLEAILFFHPVTWYLSHRLHDDRETSCDDLVLSIGGDRLHYAQSLLRVAELRLASTSQQKHLSLAADGQHPSKLRQRIARLLGDSESDSVRISSVWLAVTLLGVFVAGIWMLAATSQPVVASVADEARIKKDESLKGVFQFGAPAEPNPKVAPPLSLPVRIPAHIPQDSDGFALPSGMVQRFGSTRFRSGATSWQSVAFSEDGKWLWCKADGLTVMHRKSGHVIKGIHLGIPGEMGITSIAMSPTGKLAAVAGMVQPARNRISENAVILFDSNSGDKLSQIEWQGALGGVTYVAISHDESTLLTGDYQGDVRLWNIATGKEIRRTAVGLQFKAAAMSPDGHTVVLVGMTESRLWNLNEKEPPAILSPNTANKLAVCYSPDGRYFATGGCFETDGFRLWDGKSGEMVAQLISSGLMSHPDGGLTFTPDSRILAVPATNADCVELWDAETLNLLKTLPAKKARAVSISRDGNWLAVLGESQRIQLFDLKTHNDLKVGTSGHFDRITAVRYLNNNRVLTSDEDGSLCLWDADSGQQIFESEPDQRSFAGTMAVSPDGHTVVLNPIAEKMQMFDATTGQLLQSFPGHGRSGSSRTVQFANDGMTFVSWGDDLQLRRWNVPTGDGLPSGRSIPIVVPGYTYDPNGGMRKMPRGWLGQGSQSLFVEFSGTLRKFDASDGGLLRQIETERLTQLSASPDGVWIATIEDVLLDDAQIHSTIRLRDASTLELVHQWEPGTRTNVAKSDLENHSRIRATMLIFSHDSRRIAWTYTGNEDAAQVADIETKKIVARLPLESTASALDFSPDQTQLAIGSSDTTISLWDLSNFTIDDARP